MKTQAISVLLLVLSAYQAKAAARPCPITPVINEQPPKRISVFARNGPWQTNTTRSIWAGWGIDGGIAGKDYKVPWVRPVGTTLQIAGKRLDGQAPPLESHVPCCYASEFQATGLIFPTEGCWEITATAGEDKLTIVTLIRRAD